MKSGMIRRKMMCGLMVAMMVLACACGKGGNENTDVTPTGEATQAVTQEVTQVPSPTEAAPSATPTEEVPSATPTVTEAAATPTVTVPAEQLEYPSEAVLTPMAVNNTLLNPDHETYEVLKEEQLQGAVRGTLSNLLIRYTDAAGEFAMFDSMAYTERLQESCKSRSEELYKELSAKYTGKTVVVEKLLESIPIGTNQWDNEVRIDVYEHAVLGAAGMSDGAATKDSATPVVFRYQTDFVFIETEEEIFRGVLTEDQKAVNKAAENAEVTVDFAVCYAKKYLSGNVPMDAYTMKQAYTEAVLNSVTAIEGGKSDGLVAHERSNTARAFLLPSGKTALVFEKTALKYVDLELIQDVAVYGEDGKQLFSGDNAKMPDLEAKIAVLRECFRVMVEGGADYPIPDFWAKLINSDEYEETMDLGNGLTLVIGMNSRSYADTVRETLRWSAEGTAEDVELYETMIPEVETFYDADDNPLLVMKPYWASAWQFMWGRESQLAILHVTQKTPEGSTVKEFLSDRYAEAHRDQYEKNAAAYEKELRAAFKGKLIAREKVLETISFGDYGQILVTEHAAIGYAPTSDGNTLFAYNVIFRWEDATNSEQDKQGFLFKVGKVSNEGDSYDSKVHVKYEQHIEFVTSVLWGDSLTKVVCESDYTDPGMYSYNDEAYYDIAWFDENGAPVLRMDESWGESTDYFSIPGENRIKGDDGKVYYSLNDDILFGYHLSDLAAAIGRALTENDPEHLEYAGIPKGSLSVEHYEDELNSYDRIVFRDTVSLNADTKLVFAAEGESMCYYTIKMLYKEKEIGVTEYRMYIDEVRPAVKDSYSLSVPESINITLTEEQCMQRCLQEAENGTYAYVEEELRPAGKTVDFRFVEEDAPLDLTFADKYDYRRSYLDAQRNYRKSEYYVRNGDGTYRQVALIANNQYGVLTARENGIEYTMDVKEYDADGNCVFHRDEYTISGESYDKEGRLLTKVKYALDGTPVEVAQYSYDKNGNLSLVLSGHCKDGEIRDLCSEEYAYTVNKDGLLTGVTITRRGAWEGIANEAYALIYNADGTVLCVEQNFGVCSGIAQISLIDKTNEDLIHGKNITSDHFPAIGPVVKSGVLKMKDGEEPEWTETKATGEYQGNLPTDEKTFFTIASTNLMTERTYAYDGEGRVTQMTGYEKYYSFAENCSWKKTFRYDESGKLVGMTNEFEYSDKDWSTGFSKWINATETHAFSYDNDGCLEIEETTVNAESSVYTAVRRLVAK